MPKTINPTQLNQKTIFYLQALLKSQGEAVINQGQYRFLLILPRRTLRVTVNLTHSLLIHNKKNSALERIEVFGKKLACGSFSKVHESLGVLKPEENFTFKRRKKEKERVIKVLPLNKTAFPDVQAEVLKINKITSLDCRQAFFNQNTGFLLMKKAQGIELHKLICAIYEGRTYLNVRQKLEVTKALILAVRAVHLKGYVHGDIKPENIFIDLTKMTATLVDGAFAESITAPKASLKLKGTLAYLPPEAFWKNEKATVEADWFALGVTLFQFWGDTALYKLKETPGKTKINTLILNLLKFHKNKPFENMFENLEVPLKLQKMILGLITGLCAYKKKNRLTGVDALRRCESLLYLEKSKVFEKSRLAFLNENHRESFIEILKYNRKNGFAASFSL